MKKNVNSFKIFFAKKIKNLSRVIYLAPKAAEKRALSHYSSPLRKPTSSPPSSA